MQQEPPATATEKTPLSPRTPLSPSRAVKPMPEEGKDPLMKEAAPPKDTPAVLIISVIFVALGAGIAYATGSWAEFGVAYGVNLASFLFVAWPCHTEKYFDLTGSIAFVSTGWFSLFYRQVPFNQDHVRNLVLLVMVSLWTMRLGFFLFQRIVNAHRGKDARFDALRDNPCAFSAYWMGQGAWVYFLLLPLIVANSFDNTDICREAAAPVTALDAVGWGLWVFGWGMEVVADRQKTAFKANPDNKGKFCNAGLWSITRHPNYFGEILLWVGIAISASAVARGSGWLLFLSPAYTLFLMIFVSGVPTAENTALKKYGETEGYMDYIKAVPVLVPFCYCWTGWVGRTDP